MIVATSTTAGAGNSHWAWRWAQRDRRRGALDGPRRTSERTRMLALGAVEQVLKVFLRLREHLSRRRAFDRLLDRDADDVAVLGDADDLRQPLPADLERGLIGLIPVGGHLRLGLHLRIVPARGAADADAGHELAHHVRLVRGPLGKEIRGLFAPALRRDRHARDVDRREMSARS